MKRFRFKQLLQQALRLNQAIPSYINKNSFKESVVLKIVDL